MSAAASVAVTRAASRARLYESYAHAARDGHARVGTILASSPPDRHVAISGRSSRSQYSPEEGGMDGRTRRKIEMGQGVFGYKQLRADLGPAFATALGQLEERLKRAEEIAGRQLEGVRVVRAASQRKLAIRQDLSRTHLNHLMEVGKSASREVPELAQKFVFRPGTRSHLGFRTAARGMVAEAQTHRDVLLKYGLGEDVLADLAAALDQFDDAMEQGQA